MILYTLYIKLTKTIKSPGLHLQYMNFPEKIMVEEFNF